MTMRDIRGRRPALPVLLLLPLLGAPVFAMTSDDYGSPYTSAGEIQAAQKILQGDHYLKAGRYEAGRMDERTIDAVRAFQRSHFIPASGLLDRETIAQLVSHGSAVVAESRTGTGSGARANRGGESTATAPAVARGSEVSRTTVVEGTDSRSLSQGPGHLEGSALPGAPDNCVIAGHRDGPFGRLRAARAGDILELAGQAGGVARYRVLSVEVVGKDDTRALTPSREPRLTLVTCYPFHVLGRAGRRFVVRAALL
jgi:LPXTG-site transpeptidase (sortase) family protein